MSPFCFALNFSNAGAEDETGCVCVALCICRMQGPCHPASSSHSKPLTTALGISPFPLVPYSFAEGEGAKETSTATRPCSLSMEQGLTLSHLQVGTIRGQVAASGDIM